MTDVSELAKRAEEAGTNFILALFVDLNGKPCAKLVPVESIELLVSGGMGFAGYAVGAMGQVPRDPDLMVLPDVNSFTPIPFVKEGLAIVHCDPYVLGRPWPFAPRNILRSMIERTAAAGYEPWVGAEVEYFLVARSDDGSIAPADPGDNAAQPCYDARGVTRMYDHLTSISRAMNGLGWGNYANDHEDGNGQFEQNFEYADALTSLLETFDGFYTLLVSNADSFAVVRDAIACKPAVIAETDDWVAMGSEFRALAHLPGIEGARIWEPAPEVIYHWSREVLV